MIHCFFTKQNQLIRILQYGRVFSTIVIRTALVASSFFYKNIILVILILSLNIVYAQKNNNTIQVNVIYNSYYARTSLGGYKLRNGKPYHDESISEQYTTTASLSPLNTAFIVIDPWNNAPSSYLNQDANNILTNYLLPLVRAASQRGYSVYIFSNDCKAITPTPYSCGMAKSLQTLAKNNSNVIVNYWQNFNKISFAKMLKQKGITQIIYSGFSSNMCVLTRPAGLVSMQQLGFSLYFVPEASSAIELPETLKTKQVHKITTSIISQSIAKILPYKNIYPALIKSNS